MSQIKFGRNYNLQVQLQDGSFLQITLPFSIEFNLSRSSLGSINGCQIRIYNLSEKNRNDIRFDWSNFSGKRVVQLNAGYGDNLPLIFYGTISQAWSFREGVNFITTIECQDGAYASSNSIIPNTATFPAKTPWETIFKTLMSYVQNTSFGQIGDSFIYNSNGSLAVSSRSLSFSGSAVQNLIEITGKAFYIDNGKTYILKNTEFAKVQGAVPLISAQSGLLNTPLVELKIVTFDMIFEPTLFVGQLIKLQSQTAKYLNSKINNYYKITALRHKAMISPAVCGDAITTAQFYAIDSPI